MAEQDGILVKAKEESILEVIAEANSCMKAGGALFRENAMLFALNKYDGDPIRAFGFLAYSWRRLQTIRGRCRSVTYSRNFWQRPQVRCRLRTSHEFLVCNLQPQLVAKTICHKCDFGCEATVSLDVPGKLFLA
jgi:hypothetical protein